VGCAFRAEIRPSQFGLESAAARPPAPLAVREAEALLAEMLARHAVLLTHERDDPGLLAVHQAGEHEQDEAQRLQRFAHGRRTVAG